jgi:hypothetical protein
MSSNFLIERVVRELNKLTNITESEKNHLKDMILSKHGDDFLSHLMSPVVGNVSSEEPINEITLKDMRPRPKYRATEIPDILSHNAVTQKTPEHVAQYKKLMQNGESISQEVTNKSHKRLKAAFDEYMDGYSKNPEKRKETLRTARQHFTDYRTTRQGYGGGKPNLLGSNTKIAKNENQSENSVGLSLAPYTVHGVKGHSNCVKSVSDCQNSCLAYTTGQNAMLSNINSKIATTQYLVHHPHNFAAVLHANMLKHIDETANLNSTEWHQKQVEHAQNAVIAARKQRKNDTSDLEAKLTEAKKAQAEHANGKRYTAGFRLNTTSDYDVQDIMGKMMDHVHSYAQNKGVDMISRDYTKHPERLYRPKKKWQFNALSHTGQNINHNGEVHEESNDKDVGKALAAGHTVAGIVHGNATHVYDHATKSLYPIVDGDEEDLIERRHQQAGHITNQDGTGTNPKTGKKEGVYSALRIKGLSNEIKNAAGDFGNVTTTIKHPKTKQDVNVIEINRPVSTNKTIREERLHTIKENVLNKVIRKRA